MERSCCICKAKFEAESPAVLTMGGFANPRYLCSECESDFDEATSAKEIERISLAMDRIGEKLKMSEIDDKYVLSAIEEVMEGARERAEAIKAGTYDFSLDECEEPEKEEFEGPSEPELTEEELEKEEKSAKKQKVYDKVTNIICLVMIIAVVGFIIYRAVDMFFL